MKPQKELIEPGPEASFYCYRRVSKQFEFNWHYHAEYELTWISKGEGQRFVGDHVSEFQPGELVLLGPQLPHTWTSRGPGEAVVVQFLDRSLGEGVLERPEMRPVRTMLHRSQRGLQFDPTAFAARLDAMPQQQPGQRFVSLLSLLYDLSQSRDVRELASMGYRFTPQPGDDQRIDRVCQYVHKQLHETIEQKEAARLAHLTPSAFSRFFRRATGHRFVDYVCQRRIAEACRLLAETDQPITTISFDVGFATLSNFNRRFRHLQGMSPRQYRARHRG